VDGARYWERFTAWHSGALSGLRGGLTRVKMWLQGRACICEGERVSGVSKEWGRERRTAVEKCFVGCESSCLSRDSVDALFVETWWEISVSECVEWEEGEKGRQRSEGSVNGDVESWKPERNNFVVHIPLLLSQSTANRIGLGTAPHT